LFSDSLGYLGHNWGEDYFIMRRGPYGGFGIRDNLLSVAFRGGPLGIGPDQEKIWQ